MPTSTTTTSFSSSSASSYLMKNPIKPTAKKSVGRGKGLFVFTCGCKDSKSMCVTPSRSYSTASTTTYVSNLRRCTRLKSDTSATVTSSSTSTTFLTLNRGEQRQKSNYPDDVMEEEEEHSFSSSISPSFSSLLRELGELEQSLIELDHNSIGKRKEEVEQEEEEEEVRFDLFVEMRRRLGSEKKGSVAVVMETEDPVGDFRKSMVLMIEENDINTEEELKDLLSQFLALNSHENHHLILYAFADVCDDFFPR